MLHLADSYFFHGAPPDQSIQRYYCGFSIFIFLEITILRIPVFCYSNHDVFSSIPLLAGSIPVFTRQKPMFTI